MTTTLIPTEDQTQLLLESPMTEAELSQLNQIECRGNKADKSETICKVQKALCLLEVYNDKLFRGKAGGRTWGQYLQSIDLCKLGFRNGLDTESAADWMNFGALCDAIDDWNEANPNRPPLPYPGGASYMAGWTLLFDRERQRSGVSKMTTYAPITGAGNALQAWKTAVLKNGGDALKAAEARAIGRAARDSGAGRNRLGGADNSVNIISAPAPCGTQEPEPEYSQPTVSAADRMQAAADRAAREQRQAEAAAYEKSLRDDGIDPRLISTMEKESEFNAMTECETYSVQLGKLHQDLQTLEVWVRGRLNQYGSDGMDMLRQLDAGLYTISGDIKTLYGYRQRLDDLIELLEDDIEPGSLTPTAQAEPTR